MLIVDEIACTRGDRRLFESISFALDQGQLLHLQGQNGSGKTTLLHCVCGLIAPDSGTVYFEGASTADERDEFYHELLYIGHKNGINDGLTAIECLQFSAQLAARPIDASRAIESLRRVGLNGFEDLPTRKLSQGQKRRVALARLLTSDACIWVLDEPFSALDKVAAAVLVDAIRRHLDQGGIVLMTTHQPVNITECTIELHLGRSMKAHV